MTNTFIHIFNPSQRLVLVITEDFPQEHYAYTWVPDLKTVAQMEELLDQYMEWVNFQAQQILFEDRILDGLRFQTTCNLEWELRREQLKEKP